MMHHKICLLIFPVIIFTACSSVPRFTSGGNSRFAEKAETKNYDNYENAPVLETVKGIASFYSDKYNGRVTYSGEIYDMEGLSAAHPVYQMGTIVRITNLSNNKSVIIPINDRMPYRPDRIIDLSLGCARELNMVNIGIIDVKLEVLEWGTGKK
jgi:rare lipoprotein A